MPRAQVAPGGSVVVPAAQPGPVALGPGTPVLEVEDLRVRFRTKQRDVQAVDGLSFSLSAGETLAIIGESGSGKTVTARAMMGLLPPRRSRVSGSVRFQGEELVGLSEKQLRERRGRDIAMVFQNPERSLDPTMKVGAQLTEAIEAHLSLGGERTHERAVELLRRVRLPAPERRFFDYPHQLSGGMRQRVMIAIALACNPSVLIADEATTALDVTTQAQIMQLLLDLQQELGMALVMISHNLGLAASYAKEVIVMYAGRAVEQAPTRELFRHVRMPYTRALLDAIPRVEREAHTLLPMIEGRPPDLSGRMPGCSFAPRCPQVEDRCRREAPTLDGPVTGHRWACFYPCADDDGAAR